MGRYSVAMEAILFLCAAGFLAFLALTPEPLLKVLLMLVWVALAVAVVWQPAEWLLLQGWSLLGPHR